MKEINQGYRIIERFTVGAQGVVLAHNPDAPLPYVTWRYRTDAPKAYFWGHYFNNIDPANADYRRRIEDFTKGSAKRDERLR